jgi:hypothetical protein
MNRRLRPMPYSTFEIAFSSDGGSDIECYTIEALFRIDAELQASASFTHDHPEIGAAHSHMRVTRISGCAAVL